MIYKKAIYSYKKHNNEYTTLNKLITIYRSITKDIEVLQTEDNFLNKGDLTDKLIDKLNILIGCVDQENDESDRFISLYQYLANKLITLNAQDDINKTYPLYQELIDLMKSLVKSMIEELNNI
ncbi:MAG: hypothetical protein OEY79_01025 [Anaplasmataceae bacterium]|nr:hypothetical protein [Anaplasmataceae bacterium]